MIEGSGRRAETGPLGGAARLERFDPRLEDLASVDVVEAGKNRDREQEVATGPAATIAARSSNCVGKLTARSVGDNWLSCPWSDMLAAFAPTNLT